jgi:aconitate hydratase 2/2-methylisocitrate dehydratase
MNIYKDYIKEIEERKGQGLEPKPIDDGELLFEIITEIKDLDSSIRKKSIDFFIYNVLPGTTSAAGVKATFLKEIILGDISLEEITPKFAFELLSHMKGGPSIKILLDLALGDNINISKEATKVLKTQVFLYDADTERLKVAYNNGSDVAKEILKSYAKAEFFTKLSEVEEEIKIVTYIAGIGDISTDLLSPGGDAHSRSDRELHGNCMFEHNTDQQNELLALQKKTS